LGFDVIGDIHGHAEKLKALLERLGYVRKDGAFRHPKRTAIFVGDLIDRGPGQLETLRLVRAMVDAGAAEAAMGNHELNAIGWATEDPKDPGLHLRARHGPRGRKNFHQHEAFLTEVGADSPQHAQWVDWFMSLPVWIEKPGLRVVHACWDPRAADLLRPLLSPGQRLNGGLLEAAYRPDHAVRAALDVLLKGPEAKLPRGASFTDKEGHERFEIRTRWWRPDLATFKDAYIGPDAADLPDTPLPPAAAIPEPDRPTVIGHYWLNPHLAPEPLAPKVACVDYSVANGGPLAAYRFDGEPALLAENFVLV
jgi:hypothetical protein